MAIFCAMACWGNNSVVRILWVACAMVVPSWFMRFFCQLYDVLRSSTFYEKIYIYMYIYINIASANVLSLDRAEQGFAGKLHYLRTQFKFLHLNLSGHTRVKSCL